MLINDETPEDLFNEQLEKIKDNEIKRLRLDDLNSSRLKQVLEAIKNNNSIISLDLEDCLKENDNRIKLRECLETNMTLRWLKFEDSPDFIDKISSEIGKALETNSGLKKLVINNEIGEEGIKTIARGLQYNKTLSSLVLGDHNNLSKEAAKELANMLKVNKTLGNLSLEFWLHDPDPDAIKELSEGIKYNTSLVRLEFPVLDSGGLRELNKAIQENKTLCHLHFMPAYASSDSDDGGNEVLSGVCKETRVHLGKNNDNILKASRIFSDFIMTRRQNKEFNSSMTIEDFKLRSSAINNYWKMADYTLSEGRNPQFDFIIDYRVAFIFNIAMKKLHTGEISPNNVYELFEHGTQKLGEQLQKQHGDVYFYPKDDREIKICKEVVEGSQLPRNEADNMYLDSEGKIYFPRALKFVESFYNDNEIDSGRSIRSSVGNCSSGQDSAEENTELDAKRAISEENKSTGNTLEVASTKIAKTQDNSGNTCAATQENDNSVYPDVTVVSSLAEQEIRDNKVAVITISGDNSASSGAEIIVEAGDA